MNEGPARPAIVERCRACGTWLYGARPCPTCAVLTSGPDSVSLGPSTKVDARPDQETRMGPSMPAGAWKVVSRRAKAPGVTPWARRKARLNAASDW